jgi:hypothetical protein
MKLQKIGLFHFSFLQSCVSTLYHTHYAGGILIVLKAQYT